MTYEMWIPAGTFKLHHKGTLVITISGAGASDLMEDLDADNFANDNADLVYKLLTDALYGPGEVPKGGILSLYRYQEPSIWYLKLTKAAHRAVYEKLHGKKITLSTQDIELDIVHLDLQKVPKKCITIHWLPITSTPEAVKGIVEQITGDKEAEVYFSKHGKFRALCNPIREIPHYASVKCPDDTNMHRVLITMKGRRAACPRCELDNHCGGKCLVKKSASRQLIQNQ